MDKCEKWKRLVFHGLSTRIRRSKPNSVCLFPFASPFGMEPELLVSLAVTDQRSKLRKNCRGFKETFRVDSWHYYSVRSWLERSSSEVKYCARSLLCYRRPFVSIEGQSSVENLSYHLKAGYLLAYDLLRRHPMY